MIVCPRCGKENQDHYKFCLGCGAELPRDAAHQPKSFTAPTPPAGFPAKGGDGSPAAAGPAPSAAGGGAAPQFGGAGAGAAAASAVPAASPAPAPSPPASATGTLSCPKCNNDVPANFKFCGSCGHPMADVQAAAASAEAAPAGPAVSARPSTAPSRGSLVLIRPDGTEGESLPIGDETTVGREAGGLFASDSYLSPRHATFVFKGAELHVRDEGSLNGIYRRIESEVPYELFDGGVFRVGQEIIRFQAIPQPERLADGVERMGSPNPGFLGRISLVTGRESHGNAYCIPPEGLHLGRERGDIIFPDDGYVSGLHCRIHGEGGKVMLTDVGSSNGTFIRLDGEQPIRSGSLLLLGQQLFRVEY